MKRGRKVPYWILLERLHTAEDLALGTIIVTCSANPLNILYMNIYANCTIIYICIHSNDGKVYIWPGAETFGFKCLFQAGSKAFRAKDET